MEKIIGKRGSGRTTELIKKAAEEDLYILTPNRRMADAVYKQAKDMGLEIKHPVAYTEIMENRLNGEEVKCLIRDGVLIDETEMIIRQIFDDIQVKAITLEEDENTRYLNGKNTPKYVGCILNHPSFIPPGVHNIQFITEEEGSDKQRMSPAIQFTREDMQHLMETLKGWLPENRKRMANENRKKFRDNLLITAGARAAYMECSRVIDLPSGSAGEDILSVFITKEVDRYIEEQIDIPFDYYIESKLIGEYSLRKED